MYKLEFDRAQAILRLKLSGFWTPEVMNRFAIELTATVAALHAERAEFVILSDCREYPVQSAEVGAGWSQLLGPDSDIHEPYAVVVGSTLNKLQAERALAAPNLRVFTSLEAASDWLNDRRNRPEAREMQ